MKITVTGANGFIGTRLIARLENEGHSVRRLSRGDLADPPEQALDGCDALIHLAGEPVAQRWSLEVKKRIRDSRVLPTRALVQALSTISRRPPVFVCASAIGYYGPCGEELLTEASPPGRGFLPEVCVAWEHEADLAASLGVRVVKMRIGIVLGKEGGALPKMLSPFRAGVGGKLGSGKQWMSWIHIDDLVGLILFALENEKILGAINGCGPNPVTNAEFSEKLAATLHRPNMLTVPGFALKMLYGEMAEVVLGSQKVIPTVARDQGYAFRLPDLGPALQNTLE